LTPIGTIAAPQGGAEPAQRAAQQIVSLWNTLRKAPLHESDMWGMSPIDQMICRIQFREADYRGYFTPPSVDRSSVEYPGYNGGSDWGGVSIDPLRGVIVANYNDMPNYVRLITRAEADRRDIKPRFAAKDISTKSHSVDPQWGAPYAIEVNAGWRMPFTGLMCKRPHMAAFAPSTSPPAGRCGTAPWHGAPQRSVRRADDAAAHDRHAQQRRRGDNRQWPGIHRRRHRRPDKGDRSADGEDSVVGQSASRRPGDADHLPAGAGNTSSSLPAGTISWRRPQATA
jgi:hypothetical protein